MSRNFIAILCALAVCSPSLKAQDQVEEDQDILTLYRGAQVWTGQGFEQRDFAVRGGRIVETKPTCRALHQRCCGDTSASAACVARCNAESL